MKLIVTIIHPRDMEDNERRAASTVLAVAAREEMMFLPEGETALDTVIELVTNGERRLRDAAAKGHANSRSVVPPGAISLLEMSEPQARDMISRGIPHIRFDREKELLHLPDGSTCDLTAHRDRMPERFIDVAFRQAWSGAHILVNPSWNASLGTAETPKDLYMASFLIGFLEQSGLSRGSCPTLRNLAPVMGFAAMAASLGSPDFRDVVGLHREAVDHRQAFRDSWSLASRICDLLLSNGYIAHNRGWAPTSVIPGYRYADRVKILERDPDGEAFRLGSLLGKSLQDVQPEIAARAARRLIEHTGDDPHQNSLSLSNMWRTADTSHREIPLTGIINSTMRSLDRDADGFRGIFSR